MNTAMNQTSPQIVSKRSASSAWLRLTLAACIVLVLGVVGGYVYLRSSHPRQMAAQRLSDLIGLPVEVDDLDLGSSQTSFALRVMQPTESHDANPSELIRIASMTTDVSIYQLITGQANPNELVIRGVEINLPFDHEGKLLVNLPKTTDISSPSQRPRIQIQGATIRLRGEGRPEFVFSKVDLTAVPNDIEYRIEGSGTDEKWGQWTIRGSIQTTDRTGWIELTTPDGPVDQELLRSIPPIPEATWKHVFTGGRAAATVRFEIDSKHEFHYSVILKPEGNANVTIHDLDVPLSRVKGTIRIADEKVTLDGCQGTLADGSIDVSGVLDFQTERSKLSFDVKAQSIDVTKLPAEWGLPSQITGRLRGRAGLELQIDENGNLVPRGGGNAVIDEAKIAGLPAEVRLRLRADGRRYRFESEPQEKPNNPLPTLVSLILPILQPPLPATPKDKPKETTIDAAITLRDVDLAGLLTQLEVDLPYRLDGKVTIKVTAAVPIGSVTNRQSYRFHGTITAEKFQFEEFAIRDVHADLDFRNGILTLGELRAKVFSSDGKIGTISGTARAAIEPRGDLSARLTLDNLPLEEVVRAIPDFDRSIRGTMSGQADLQAPIEEFNDRETWNGTASLKIDSLVREKTEIGNLDAKANLSNGVLSLTEMNAEIFKGSISGKADLPIVDSKPGTMAVDFKEIDSATATRLLPGFPVALTGKLSGRVAATAKPVTDAKPRVVDGSVDLSSQKMTVQGIPAERLSGRVTIAEGVATYQLEGQSLGGTFDVKGQYPSKKSDEEPNQVRLRNFDLSRLSPALQAPHWEPLRGLLNLTLNYKADGSTGTGRVAIEGMKWGRDSLGQSLIGTIQLRDGVLDLRDFGGELAGGRLRLRARYDTADPRRNFYTLTLDRAALKRISWLLPGGFDTNTGDVTIVARGRIGPQAGASVTLSFSAATVSGIPVTDLRIPLEWTGGLSTGRLVVREGNARLGHGAMTINLAFDYGPVSRLTGQIRFNQVPLQSLIGTSVSAFGNGRISGRFDLEGNAIRSLDDVKGTLNAKLNSTSVREVPLIKLVTPYLSPLGFLQPFETGEIKGRLAGGVFRLERFVLSNPGAHVFAEGSVTRKGRIDLDVVAVTGQIGPNVRGLRLLGINLPALSPLPVSLVMNVSELLSNRMVRLRITGTLKSPEVQINKAALLTDTAVRFFLGQYVIPESIRE
jgi:hypothetical protein